MEYVKCKFAKDTQGFYMMPLIGYSNVKGKKSIWIGWLWWIFSINLTRRDVET